MTTKLDFNILKGSEGCKFPEGCRNYTFKLVVLEAPVRIRSSDSASRAKQVLTHSIRIFPRAKCHIMSLHTFIRSQFSLGRSQGWKEVRLVWSSQRDF